MAKQAVARAIDLDPIDRLEEKIKLRARLADAQGAGVELDALREEREAVRQRVAEMLSHLETI